MTEQIRALEDQGTWASKELPEKRHCEVSVCILKSTMSMENAEIEGEIGDFSKSSKEKVDYYETYLPTCSSQLSLSHTYSVRCLFVYSCHVLIVYYEGCIAWIEPNFEL